MNEKPDAVRFADHIDVERSRYIVKVAEEPDFPVEWSLIVGDFVHNLRSALDHLVNALVIANGFRPTTNTAFPIFDVRPPASVENRERRRWNSMTQGVPPGALRLIERCQPWQTPGRDGPRTHILHALRKLSNEDKHRVVLANFGAFREKPPKPVKLYGKDVRILKGGQIRKGVPYKKETTVVEVPIEITGPDPNIESEGEIPMDIAFGGGEPIVQRRTMPTMIHLVSEAVAALEAWMLGYRRKGPFFPEDPLI